MLLALWGRNYFNSLLTTWNSCTKIVQCNLAKSVMCNYTSCCTNINMAPCSVGSLLTLPPVGRLQISLISSENLNRPGSAAVSALGISGAICWGSLWLLNRHRCRSFRVSLLASCKAQLMFAIGHHHEFVWNSSRWSLLPAEGWISWPPVVSPDVCFCVISGVNGSEPRTFVAQDAFISTDCV